MDKKVLVAATGVVAASLMGIYYLATRHSEPQQQSQDVKTTSKSTTQTKIAQQTSPKPSSNKDSEVEISAPFNLSKDFSIKFDPSSGFYGVPDEVRKAVINAGFTEEQVKKDPSLIKNVLYSLDYNEVKNNTISSPTNATHNIHIYINNKTNKIEGIPDVVREAITKKGYSDEDLIKNPQLIQDLLYSFDMDEVMKKHQPQPHISNPVSVTHDFSISYNPTTGEVTGVPQPILDAIKNAGYTMKQVLADPMLVKNLLYNFDYDSLKPNAPQISTPTNFSHDFSIKINPQTGEVMGAPQEILDAIKNAGYTMDQVLKKPELVKNLIYSFDYDSLKPDAVKISTPQNVTHDFSINFNPETGEVKGVPQEILDAIKNAGYTIDQVIKNPELVKDLVYSFDYNSLKPNAPKISAPIQTTHDFQIRINPQTGELTGVPQQVVDAIKKAGYTTEQVMNNPMLAKDILYSLDYEQLKYEGSSISRPVHVEHDFSISYDTATGKFTGIPPVIEEALKKAGTTLDEALKNPSLLSEILYSQDYKSVKEQSLPQISLPSNVQHDFSIKYDPVTGKVEGIPEEIRQAFLAKGLTEKDVIQDPGKVKEMLYEHDYNQVLEKEKSKTENK
jgi:hypothetical protein